MKIGPIAKQSFQLGIALQSSHQSLTPSRVVELLRWVGDWLHGDRMEKSLLEGALILMKRPHHSSKKRWNLHEGKISEFFLSKAWRALWR